MQKELNQLRVELEESKDRAGALIHENRELNEDVETLKVCL